ncbi:uncharacterized protein RJT20DRAFT_124676 [Scheffersomyces xylosifermentans]|uniref:uncharacterized protein n=1 Tax=Scheffersomyces xylosifermentans TaxID=1304137 RepID=UPI00315DC652
MATTSSQSQDYYQLLGLSHAASVEEIKKAYKKLSLKYHPDKTPNKAHHDLFIKLNEAYDILKDPETKRKYDAKIGLNSMPATSYSFTYSPYTSGGSTGHFSFKSTGSAGGASTSNYFGFYQNFYGRKDDSVRRAEEERARFEAARIQKEMLERARAEEMIRKKKEQEKAEKLAKQQREAEEAARVQREAQEAQRILMERVRQENERLQKEAAAQLEEEKARQEATMQMKQRLYDKAKREARATQSHSNTSGYTPEDEFDRSYRINNMASTTNGVKSETKRYYSSGEEDEDTNDSGGPGHNSSDPIVLDDDDEDSNDGTPRVSSKLPNTGGTTAQTPIQGFVNLEEVDDIASSFDENAENESSSDPDHDPSLLSMLKEAAKPSFATRPRTKQHRTNMRTVSPTRPSVQAPTSNTRETPIRSSVDGSTPMTNSAKRYKKSPFMLNDMQESLGQNIDSTDFSDMFNSLPNEDLKGRRKLSENIAQFTSKRTRFSEYSNGKSRAETLSTPINKNAVRGYAAPEGKQKKISKLTELDLHASPSIHTYTPPEPPNAVIDPTISDYGWRQYVSSIQKYQKDFLTYKQHIIQYQMERAEKDLQYYDIINSDSVSFDVYHKCLQRDLDVNQEFTDSLRVYTNTMKVYKQNCDWMNMARNGGEEL